MFTEKILNTAYSWAAAVVVFGAWAKLEHKEFGTLALTIGMLVESGIFVIYGVVGWWEKHNPNEKPSSTSTAIQSTTVDVDELQQTMKQTNNILRKIFRTGET